MLLCIDVGNTTIVFGLFDGPELRAKFHLTTGAVRTADEIGLLATGFFDRFRLDASAIQNIVVGSVVPPLMYTLLHALEKYFARPLHVVGETLPLGLVNLCEEPLGVDRAVTGVAAMAMYGTPVIVVDFGTATKADAFNAAGEYMGGVICPGIQISMDALFARAAKLPRIELKKPRAAIGVNTVEQMQAGAVYGYVGGVEGIVAQIRAEMGGPAVPVVATGGLAPLIAEHTASIAAVDRNLTLHGLRLVFERNG
ncbi:MAG: type III pantothenate kinase [Oscillospiraceae bacterium]|nr:type III pantothenate kinase [Oscillospiraceae bacterium]